MKNVIQDYGWIVITLIILSILIGISQPIVRYAYDNGIRPSKDFIDTLPDEQGLSYTVRLNTNIPKAGTISFKNEYSGTKVLIKGKNTLTFVATQNEGYTFLGWYLGDTLISDKLEASVSVKSTVTITARYEVGLAPGLYESGAKYDNQIMTWEALVKEGILTSDGKVVPGQEIKLAGDLVISKDVTTISEKAFFLCTELTGVVIPNSVTKIEDSAFNSCTKLKYVNFAGGITTIGDFAFNSCNSLEEITIPTSVSYIGESAFAVCIGLKKATFEKDMALTEISKYMFNSCMSLETVVLPSKIKTIDELAFGNCENLKQVVLPKDITNIADSAFYRCEKMTLVPYVDN